MRRDVGEIAGRSHRLDVFVPTNYTISNYVELDLIQELDLSKIPNYDASAQNPLFAEPATVNGKVYAVPKNWGTTGFVVNTTSVRLKIE